MKKLIAFEVYGVRGDDLLVRRVKATKRDLNRISRHKKRMAKRSKK